MTISLWLTGMLITIGMIHDEGDLDSEVWMVVLSFGLLFLMWPYFMGAWLKKALT